MMIGRPVTGQEMIVKHIHDDRGVFTVDGAQPFLAFLHNGMGIGKSINHTVQTYSFEDISLIQSFTTAFDMVGDEVPYHQTGMIGGKIEVSEVVQSTEWMITIT